MYEELTGTKEQLFDIALEMFANKGYENVSIRDIAKEANIKTASIYYHFSSKEEILDCIFQHFTAHFFDSVKGSKEMNKVIETGSYLDIINAASWKFSGTPKEQKRMTSTLKIIYMRIMTRDEKAKKIFMDVIINGNWEWAKKGLEYAVSVGKLSSDLNIKAFFETLLFTQLCIGIVGLTGDYTGGPVEPKPYLNEFLAQLLESYHKNTDKD